MGCTTGSGGHIDEVKWLNLFISVAERPRQQEQMTRSTASQIAQLMGRASSIARVSPPLRMSVSGLPRSDRSAGQGARDGRSCAAITESNCNYKDHARGRRLRLRSQLPVYLPLNAVDNDEIRMELRISVNWMPPNTRRVNVSPYPPPKAAAVWDTGNTLDTQPY